MTEWLGGLLKPLVPGAIGAALAACLGRRLGKLHMTLSFFVGFASAAYATEPVIDYFRLSHDVYSGGIGFILGFFSMSIFSRLLNLVYETDLKGIIESKLK